LPDVSACVLSHLSGVLLQQSAGAANIFDATQGAAVHLDIRRAAADWSNRDIENSWDVVKKWTDALAPIALIAGAILLTQNEKNGSDQAAAALIGSGAGLLLIGSLGTLGQIYGGVDDKQRALSAKRTIDTLQDIEASRQAYEDSQLVYGFLDSYSRRSAHLLELMAALSQDAQELAEVASSPGRSKRIVELCDRTMAAASGFRESAGLAGDHAGQLLRLYGRYADEVALPEDRKKIEDAQQQLKRFRDAYYGVIVPFLEGLPEELEALHNIKAAVLANSIAEKQYF